MQHLEVSVAVRYIYVIRRLKVKHYTHSLSLSLSLSIYIYIYIYIYIITKGLSIILDAFLLLFVACKLIDWLIDWLIVPWSRFFLQKLTGFQLVKKFVAFCGTRKFISAFTSACHLSLFRARSINSIFPHPISWRPILVLSSHLHLGLPSGLFLSGIPTKTLHTPLLSHTSATCPTHLILLDFITRTIMDEEYRDDDKSLARPGSKQATATEDFNVHISYL